jgi:hypothetical protein
VRLAPPARRPASSADPRYFVLYARCHLVPISLCRRWESAAWSLESTLQAAGLAAALRAQSCAALPMQLDDSQNTRHVHVCQRPRQGDVGQLFDRSCRPEMVTRQPTARGFTRERWTPSSSRKAANSRIDQACRSSVTRSPSSMARMIASGWYMCMTLWWPMSPGAESGRPATRRRPEVAVQRDHPQSGCQLAPGSCRA